MSNVKKERFKQKVTNARKRRGLLLLELKSIDNSLKKIQKSLEEAAISSIKKKISKI